MFELGAGVGADTETGAALFNANKQRLGTPLSVLICPSRRESIAYPTGGGWGVTTHLIDPSTVTVIGHTDYAVNNGDFWPLWGPGPGSFSAAAAYFSDPGYLTSFRNCNGILFSHYRMKETDITDGLSNTYMIGEKYINPDVYTTGTWYGDDQGPLIGDDWDTSRATGDDGGNYLPPVQDTAGWSGSYEFGSAHSNGFNMALCDGSVRCINYTISKDTHRHLSNRKDGYSIDPNQF